MLTTENVKATFKAMKLRLVDSDDGPRRLAELQYVIDPFTSAMANEIDASLADHLFAFPAQPTSSPRGDVLDLKFASGSALFALLVRFVPDDDTAADEAQAADFTAKSRAGAITSALRMQQFDLLTAAFTGSPVTLQAGIHTGVVRCALGAPDGRFVTAGEDGTLAIWRLGDQNDGTDSSRSSASEGKVTAGGAHHAARRRAAAPY